MKLLIALSATLLVLSTCESRKIIERKQWLGDEPYPPDEGKTCMLKQSCKRTDGSSMETAECPSINPEDLEHPTIEFYEPALLYRDDSKANLKEICPEFDPETPICCNDDQVQIMVSNYKQIDSVFSIDCPICGINLKRMWCEYTCNTSKYKFVEGLYYMIDPET